VTVPPPGGTSPGTATAALSRVEAVQRRLANLVSGLDCAAIKVEVNNELAVRLTGSIDSQKNQAEFLRQARAIDGVSRVDSAVAVRPWPQCELDGVADLVTAPEFRITPNKLDKPYKIEKDAITFKVGPPPGRQGYLNVVFLQSDKTAFHYEPWSQVSVQLSNRGVVEKSFGEKEQITLSPPAGKMAIVAVFSFDPLTLVTFPTEGQDKGQANQNSKEYFANLKRILANHPGAIVSYIVFDTIL